MKQLVLGSNSPRRKEILTNLGFKFIVRTTDEDEILPDNYPIEKAAEFLAKQKADFIEKNANEVLLTADTVVIHNQTILGKPKDRAMANKMLTNLSGQTHEVVTGVYIWSPEQSLEFSSSTMVKFKDLTQEEIDYYINQFAPFDKAGAYGIQEWIGQIGVEWIKGAYFNVMGLPTKEVYEALSLKFDIQVQ